MSDPDTHRGEQRKDAFRGPEAKRRRAEIDQAIANLRSLRRRTGKITVEELLARRHEGHKY